MVILDDNFFFRSVWFLQRICCRGKAQLPHPHTTQQELIPMLTVFQVYCRTTLKVTKGEGGGCERAREEGPNLYRLKNLEEFRALSSISSSSKPRIGSPLKGVITDLGIIAAFLKQQKIRRQVANDWYVDPTRIQIRYFSRLDPDLDTEKKRMEIFHLFLL